MSRAHITVPDYCAAYPPQTLRPGDWQSIRVFHADGGRLAYSTDADGSRIPDYSYAGYRYGEESIPHVPEVVRLTPPRSASISSAAVPEGRRRSARRPQSGAHSGSDCP
jgi:hypothetical protein